MWQQCKLHFDSILRSEAAGGVVWPLWCDARSGVLPLTNHLFALSFDNIRSIRNTSAVVRSCGYCMAAIQVALRFNFLPPGAAGDVV